MCDSWSVFRLSCESHDGLPNDSSTMLSTVLLSTVLLATVLLATVLLATVLLATVLLATSNRLRVSVFRILPVGDSAQQ